MLFDLVDMLQRKRRLIFVAMFFAIDFWLLLFCTQILQTHRADITARIHTSQATSITPTYQSSSFDMSSISTGVSHFASAVEVGVLRATVATADGITHAKQGVQTAGTTTLRATSSVITTTNHAAGKVVLFTGKIVAFPFIAAGHGIGHVASATSRAVSSPITAVIQPKQNTAVPVITPEQAHQAFLIQDGTLNVEPTKPTGAGGACDNGAGNGGYPMEWCNAAMDTIRTIGYSADRINRECTSYAYWYFTAIEGRPDFRVTGNANRWAYTSNFPTFKTPAVGAIAVETAGAYGHVAIVHALPGQMYEGKVVPAGYVLVSEMNYDWHGHFRYSYSPLGKFSAYIYAH